MMDQTGTNGKVRISRGKYNGLNAVANESGIIAAAAMDQRRTLRKAISQAKGSDATEAELSEFKKVVTEALTPYASAVLLDPEYGLEAVKAAKAVKHPTKEAGVGVLLAYERTGYEDKRRLPRLLQDWSVKRLADNGADAIKLLLYYDSEDKDHLANAMKREFIESVGKECQTCDIPFFLEVVSYSNEIGDEKGSKFAAKKPEKVKEYMKEFSQQRYGVDVLKVEVPVNVHFVEGLKANKVQQVIYSRAEALDCFREAAAASKIPFIYLSAGVTIDVFLETLELATEAGTPFSGVLCGRATWQDGIKEYTRGGETALRLWFKNQGVPNIQALNQMLKEGAKPWWTIYGGKENIEIVDTQT